MRYSWRWLVVLALAATVALAAACDDGDGNGADDGAADATATEALDNGEPTADDGEGATDETAQELESLAERWQTTSAKVSYTFSSTAAGETTEGTMTLYWRPPDFSRVDFSMEGADGSFISSAGASYICSSDGAGGGQCLESTALGDAASALPFLGFLSDPDAFNDVVGASFLGVDVDRSERDIAGESASCYSVAGEVEGETGSAEYCFSDDGILLLAAGALAGATGSAEYRLEATSVEGEVSEADTTPPYPVMEIPGVQ